MKTSFITACSAFLLSHIHRGAAQSCSPLSDVKITFFGYPDNSPPGAGLAFTQCGHSLAGGTGSYDDPISFATATDGDFKVCDVVYLPWVKKYARYEDDCEQCGEDWDKNHEYHIDLWTGSTTENGGQTQIDCENSLPGGPQTIVRNPPKNLETDTAPFFANGNCNRKTYPVGSDTSLCSSSSGGGGGSSATSTYTPTTLASTTKPATPSQSAKCTWTGHCLGAPCQDYNDCDGQLICTDHQCAVGS
ncbi:MAG: hypothetical protein Q9191_004566 [Dirinaria sp. TL-2023a]